MSQTSVPMVTEDEVEINQESQITIESQKKSSIISDVSALSTISEFSRISENTTVTSIIETEQPKDEEVTEPMEEKISTKGEVPAESEAPSQEEDGPKTEAIPQTQEQQLLVAEEPPATTPKQSEDVGERSSSVVISYAHDDDEVDVLAGLSLAKSISQLMSKAKRESEVEEEELDQFDSRYSLVIDYDTGEEETSYIYVEETVMDDLGKEVKFQQKVPILRETRKYEMLSDTADEEGEEKKINVFLEHITRIIKKSQQNAEGEIEDVEQEITETNKIERPPPGVEIFTKRLNEKGEEIEVILSPDEYEEKISIISKIESGEVHVKPRKERHVPKHIKKLKVMKLMQTREVEPCTQGKVHDVIKPVMKEEVEEESEIEDYLLVDEEELSEEELAELHEEIQRKKEEKMKKLADSLRTVLVRIALAEKKRNLYMQLISISAEVKEDILNPPDPDKPTFKVPKKTKTEDKFRKMYLEKLMEYRELRSIILVKLAMEKKRKEEVKKKYDVIAAEVDHLRKSLEEKLHGAISKLLPKHDPVFNRQSPQAMVKRVLNLVEKLDHETKELMYKKKQMYIAKQKYDEVTENEQGLGYKFAVASKDLLVLGSKNDRRNEKLEALKAATQKESLAITHINQKCDVIMKTTDGKKEKLEALNRSLNIARQDRKDVHCARRKVEAELRDERAKTKLKNHPSLIREYNLVEELFKAKQIEYQQLRRECGPSLEHYKQFISKQNQQ